MEAQNMPPSKHTTSQYDDPRSAHQYSPACRCIKCFQERTDRLIYPARPVMRLPWRTWICLAFIAACALTAGILAAKAVAREGGIRPIIAPAALTRARAACPIDKPLTCRAELRRAYQAIEWQKDAREHTEALTVQAITRDAITWAAERYGVSAAQMTTVGNCESHLWPFATNGQYAGVFQLSPRHRSDPVFSVVPWQDAYAQASHVARYVKAHSWSEWQCTPYGGLRW